MRVLTLSTMLQTAAQDWSSEVFAAMRSLGIGNVCTIPDGGLTPLLRMCEDDPGTRVLTLSTEEEGIGITTGLWLGGARGMTALQSSGVGNCINALTLPAALDVPCLMLVTMRGQYGEFNHWQIPMGQAAERVLTEIGVRCYPVDRAEDVCPAFIAAANMAFNANQRCAVLIGQRVIGAKAFGRAEDG
ncbi:MAG: thiamine pyrophosphate-binding protein [Pseudomonadota bacterium]